MIKLHKLQIEEIGEKENIKYNNRLYKKMNWRIMDLIHFTPGDGTVMRHQRIFVVEEMSRSQYYR